MKTASKHLNFDFQVTSVTKDASGECIIEGYANTSTKDRVGDIVLPKAFEKSLPNYLDNPVLLENHNWDKIAGVTQTAEITDKGLFIRARISDTRPDLKTQVRERCLRTFSIGYNELDADYDESTKTKVVKELELLEISIVSVPANPEAKFQEVSGNQAIEAPKETSSAASAAEASQSSDAEAAKAIAEGYSKDQAEAIVFHKVNKIAKPLGKLLSFIETVKNVCDIEELDQPTVLACCEHYKSDKEPLMTKIELIKALKEKIKSAAEAVVPPATAPATAKADGAPAGAEAPKASSDDIGKALTAIAEKLGQIADGVAQLLEMEGKEDAEDAAEDGADANPKPGDKPAPADDGKAAAPAPCEKCGGEMKDESEDSTKCAKCGNIAPKEAEKTLEQVDQEIAELEAQIVALDV